MTDIKLGKGRGRKPVNTMRANLYGQDAIWAGVRTLKVFSIKDLVCWVLSNQKSNISDHTVKSYVTRLLRGNYLSIDSVDELNGSGKKFNYKLIHDCGVEAPRLCKDGSPSKQGLGREHMWRTIKIIKEFDFHELAIIASTEQVIIKPNEAKAYLLALSRAGYVQVKSQKSGSAARYRFNTLKNTGPKPPKVQRSKAVFDQNLNKVVWEAEKNKMEVA